MPFLPPLLLAAAPVRRPPTSSSPAEASKPPPARRCSTPVVIDRDRLTGSASGRLEDVLRDVPGFQLFRRSDSRSANPTSQGATLRALGGNASSRLLLVLDGVPQTDPFGGWVSWPAYDPERLGEARVTRGGGSGVQGPGALAGTIELASATPAELRGPRGRLAYGSRDGFDAHAGLGAAARRRLRRRLGRLGARRRLRPDRPRAARPGRPAFALRADQRRRARRRAAVRAGPSFRRALSPFPTSASGAPPSPTSGPEAPTRRCGWSGRRWSALAYVQTRDFYNSFASVNAARTAANRTSEQYSVPATGLGARVEARPKLGSANRAPARRRLAPDRGRDAASVSPSSPAPARAGGWPAGGLETLGGFAEAAWTAAAVTLTAGGRIDRWTIADGRLHERVLATGAVLTDTAFRDRSGWEPTGRAGIAWRAARRADPARRRLSRLAAADPERALPAVPGRRRCDRGQCRARAGAAAGRRGGPRLAAGAAGADRPHPVRQPARRRDRQRHPRPRARHFPGSRLRRRGRRLSPAGQSRCDRGAGSRARRPLRARRLDCLGRLVLGRRRSRGERGGAGAGRPQAGPDAAAQPVLDPGLGRRRRPRLGHRRVTSGAQYEDDLNRQRLPGAFTLDAAGAAPARPRPGDRGAGGECRSMPGSSPESAATASGRGRLRARFWIGLRLGGLR